MLPRHLGSFLAVLAVICGGLSTLKFATRSCVRAGTEVHETWTNEFTIDARQDSKTHYPVDDAIKSELENGVAFLGTGVVQVRSSAVRITPKTVSWTRNKTSYKAPGGQMIADVRSEERRVGKECRSRWSPYH